MDQLGLTLDFSNPEEVSDKEVSDILGIDFGDSLKEEVEEKPKISKKTETKVETEEEEEKDETLKLNPTEEETVEEGDEKYVSVINTLADLGFKEVWEGFDPNAPLTEEVVQEFIEFNINKKVQDSFDEFFGTLSDYSKRILTFDVNAKGKDVDQYLRTLIEENNIKSLSLDSDYDQEKIVRQWYKNEDQFTVEEIEEKIQELKDSALLEKEAKRLKPKLDAAAENIAKGKEEEQRNLRELEKQVSENYQNRVIETLKKGEVGGIKLSKEDASQIYSFLTNEEMEVNTHGGKKVTMTPLEAIVFYNKYDKNGSIERLALATLLLTNPEKFEEAFKKKAMTKVTTEVVDSIKQSNRLKIGGGQTEKSKPTSVKKEEIYRPWPKWD